ncbi:unnamed protein product, partial [Cyprideis torosa]
DFIPRVVCPANYIAIGLNCYSFQLEPLIWDEAREICQSDDFSRGDLVVFEDRNEAELVTYYLQNKYGADCTQFPRAWIGAGGPNEQDLLHHWIIPNDVDPGFNGDAVFEPTDPNSSGTNWLDGAPQCVEIACAVYLVCSEGFQWYDWFEYSTDIDGFICEHKRL